MKVAVISRRRARLLAVLVVLLTSLMAPYAQHHAAADQFDEQIAALQQQAGALQQQAGALQQQSSAAAAQALATQQALAATQAQLATAQIQLDAANQRLAATTASLHDTETQLAADRQELSQLTVAMYQLRSNGTVTTALVDSKSFVDAMQTITSVSQVSSRTQTLVDEVRTKDEQLTALRATQQVEQQQATQLVNRLQRLAAQQHIEEQRFQEQAAALTGQAGSAIQQLHAVEGQIAGVRAEQAAARAAASAGSVRILGGGLPPFAFGARDDPFPWGQCTWYVASLRDVSWNGDAWVWAWSAADAGAPEGMQPRTGAIAVFGPGGAYSGFGHVAYVVAVDSPTSFTVDEGNFLGLGVIDRRHIGSLSGVETFIY